MYRPRAFSFLRVPASGPKVPSWGLRGLRLSSSGLLLLVILGVALGLRLYGIGWDDGHGFHPDERSLYMRSDCMYRVLTEAPGYDQCVREHPETEPGAPSIGTALDADRSPLNPHWFPLGSLLIYVMVVIRLVVEPFTDMSSLLSMAYAGRTLTALADVGSVFMVYLLGKRIYNARAGLLAAALVALAVVHIQMAHFYRPEPFMVLFLLGSFWSMLQVMERRRLRDWLVLGLFIGLTLSMKVSVLPLVLPLVLMLAFRLFTTRQGAWTAPAPVDALRLLVQVILGVATAVAVFFITMPYAFLDLFEFVDQIRYQVDNVARTAGLVPFTVQYIGTEPFLYELRQTSLWGFGLPLGVVAWGGLLFTIGFVAFMVLRKNVAPRGEILLLAWVLPNLVLLSAFEVKFLRYIFPVLPFLVLMGSGMLVWTLDRARSLAASSVPAHGAVQVARGYVGRYGPRIVVEVVVFVVAATAFYALAFETVYSRPHTAVQASVWINENVPRGSTVVTDNHWDEGIPDIYGYNVRQIPIYEHDTSRKMEAIAGHLSQGDYLVFYSNRTYGSVARLPERYPMSSRYYQKLFSGELGYTLIRSFTSYPKLLGVAFVDDTYSRAGLPEPEPLFDSKPAAVSLNLGYADENVINYDHPKLLLFRNEAGLSQQQLSGLLTVGGTARPTTAPALGLMMSDDLKEEQRRGGTWSEIISRDSWTNGVPVLAWLLLVEVIYLAALPLAMFLFRPLPDRGVILAKLLGILGVSYVAWLLASLGWLGFSRTSVMVGILVVAALSGLVLATRWREVRDFVVKNWRLIAIGEALFLVAFLAFVAVRWANPDLWHWGRGGEKPMDFAYLNAVLRSTYMPPYDPWFAGGYLNYYYWGQFIVATLIKGTGILPSVAYNLAVPLLFALTVTGAYSLVYNLTAGIRRGAALTPGPSPGGREEEEGGGRGRGEGLGWLLRWTRRVASGPAAAAGTLTPGPSSGGGGDNEGGGGSPSPPRRGVVLSASKDRGEGAVAWGPVGAGLVAALFVTVIGNLDGIAQVVRGGWNTAFHGSAYPSLTFISDFWRSSRMIPQLEEVTPSALTFWLPDKVGSNPEMGFHITEFPFFSFLFADLHAHMIVIPFTLLALGLAVSLLVGLRGSSRWWLAATGTALAVAVGALWAINSWDYPTYILLAVLLIGVGVWLARGSPRWKLGTFLALAVGVGTVSILAFGPFHTNYHPFPTGIVVNKWQTPILHFLGIHGLFVFLMVSFLMYLSRDRLRDRWGALVQRPTAFWDAPASTLGEILAVPWTALVGFVMVVAIVYMGATGYWTAAFLTLILGLTTWTAWEVLARREEGAPYAIVPLALIGMALLIGIGVEFVRVKDDIGRMNTLFKYYLEVWVFFGMASAYALWFLASRGAFRRRGLSWPRGLWLAALAILVLSSFIYPVLGTRSRIADRFSTENMSLDGADFMSRTVHSEEGRLISLRWDLDAIRWLQDNVEGSPVILEAHHDQYHWTSRIANYTGLPTVLGWPWHQIQQRMRYNDVVRQRAFDVTEIYSTTRTDRAMELLRQYEVKYVVLGELERAHYPDHGIRKFDQMAGQGWLEEAYRNEGVTIYRVPDEVGRLSRLGVAGTNPVACQAPQ